MTYVCPDWVFAAETELALTKKDRCTICNFTRYTPTRHCTWFYKIPYVCGFITKLSRQQAEVKRNHDNENIRDIVRGEVEDRKYKTLKPDGDQA
jgi:hypothetical protein